MRAVAALVCVISYLYNGWNLITCWLELHERQRNVIGLCWRVEEGKGKWLVEHLAGLLQEKVYQDTFKEVNVWYYGVKKAG